MKKIKTTFLLLIAIGLSDMQAQQTTDAAGGDATGSGGTSSYSVGQVVYNSVNSAGGTSNEGVQQPYEFLSVGIMGNNNISLAYSLYPNPVSGSVTLNVENKSLENLTYQLYDINGKLLISKEVNSTISIIPMETYANATYLLKVNENNKEIKTFKIIKNK